MESPQQTRPRQPLDDTEAEGRAADAAAREAEGGALDAAPVHEAVDLAGEGGLDAAPALFLRHLLRHRDGGEALLPLCAPRLDVCERDAAVRDLMVELLDQYAVKRNRRLARTGFHLTASSGRRATQVKVGSIVDNESHESKVSHGHMAMRHRIRQRPGWMTGRHRRGRPRASSRSGLGVDVARCPRQVRRAALGRVQADRPRPGRGGGFSRR